MNRQAARGRTRVAFKVLAGKYLAAAAHIPVRMAGSEGRKSGGLECKSNACKTWVVRRIETSRATLTGAAEEDLRDIWMKLALRGNINSFVRLLGFLQWFLL